jgi:hypothetical protein
MNKKIKWIIVGAVSLTLIVFACLYFIPKTTPIDITLDATKYDGINSHTALGTVQIHIHGTLKEYLFRDNTLTFTIDDFDHLFDLHAWDSRYQGSPYITATLDEDDEYNYFNVFQASSTITGEGSAQVTVIFRHDLKQWELFVNDHILADEAVKDDPSLNLAYRATLE